MAVPVGTFAVGLGIGIFIGPWGTDDDGEDPVADATQAPPASTSPAEETTPAQPEPSEEQAEPAETSSTEDGDTNASRHEESHSASTQREADPENPRNGDVFTIGDRIHFAGMEITYTDVDVTEAIQTVDGGTISADDGEFLVLLSSDFTNPGPGTVDLSCSGAPDAFIEMFDWDDNEIAPVFDTYRVPGNPECNEQLLVGQGSEWNTVWRGVEGSEPAYLTIHDINTWDFIAVTLHEDAELVIE